MKWTAEFFRAQDEADINGKGKNRAYNKVWCATEDGRRVFAGGTTDGDPNMHLVQGWVVDGTRNESFWDRTPDVTLHALRPDYSIHGIKAWFALQKAKKKYGPDATVVSLTINNIWILTLLVPENPTTDNSSRSFPLLLTEI